jgi:MFS family permease
MVGKVITPAKRPSYLGLLGATINLAQAFGPLIGGALADRTSTIPFTFTVHANS